MKKILLIRLSSLGDVIFNIPLANVLKNNGFEVTWLVSEKGIDVVKDNPAVHKAILLPTKTWKKRGFCLQNVKEFFTILKEIRTQKFDVAIDCQMMFKSLIFMRLCRAKRKICYTHGREFSHFGGNEKINYKPNQDFSVHAVFQHLSYAEYLGLKDTDKVIFTLPKSSDETVKYVDELLKDVDKSKPIAIIAPATTWKLKHWNKDNWRILVEKIKDKYSLVFTGTDADKELISYISSDNFTNLAGKTKVKELIELFSRAKVVIAPDSGSAHLARATNMPAVITIFCCTPKTMYGPFGDVKKYFAVDGDLKCQPCHKRACDLSGDDYEKCVNYPLPEKIADIALNLS